MGEGGFSWGGCGREGGGEDGDGRLTPITATFLNGVDIGSGGFEMEKI